MKVILDLFSFAAATWGTLVARFAVLLVLSVLVVWLAAFIILQISKKKEHKVAFTNWFKYCLLWAIDIALFAIGVVAILTIKSNGLFYFNIHQFSFTTACGYILMLPEVLLIIGWIVAYWMINKSIVKSI